jgi:hypothetical protein
MTTNNSTPNQTTEKQLATKTMNGIDLHLASFASIPLDAATYTPLTLKQVFQDEITALEAADAQKAVWHQKVVDAQAKVTRARQVRLALKRWIVATQGAQVVQVYEDLGMDPPKKPGIKTAASKAASAAKARATRAAKKAALAAAAAPKTEPTPPAK